MFTPRAYNINNNLMRLRLALWLGIAIFITSGENRRSKWKVSATVQDRPNRCSELGGGSCRVGLLSWCVAISAYVVTSTVYTSASLCSVSSCIASYQSCALLEDGSRISHIKNGILYYLCWYKQFHLLTFSSHSPVFTARCTLVQSAVLRSHVVRLSVRPSVRLWNIISGVG